MIFIMFLIFLDLRATVMVCVVNTEGITVIICNSSEVIIVSIMELRSVKVGVSTLRYCKKQYSNKDAT